MTEIWGMEMYNEHHHKFYADFWRELEWQMAQESEITFKLFVYYKGSVYRKVKATMMLQ